MSTDEAVFARLLEALYAATDKPGGWAHFLNEFGEAVNSGPTALMSQDFRDNRNSVMAAVRVDPRDLALFQNQFSLINPWMQPHVRHRHRPGVVVYGEEIVPHEVFERSAFYHEFGKRSGIVYALGTTVSVEGEVHALLSTNRGEDRGPFNQEEHSVLEQLAPHVTRVLTWQSRLSGYRRLEELFDLASEAIWEVDETGWIRKMNAAGRTAVEAAVLIRSREGRLEVRQKGVWRTVLGTVSATRAMRASLSMDGLSLKAVLTCYPLEISVHSPRKAYAIVLNSLASPPPAALESAGRLLGLTRAEGRLVAKLFVIPNMVEAAAALGISANTAKSQLTSAMRKTGTQSKVELMLRVRQSSREM